MSNIKKQLLNLNVKDLLFICKELGISYSGNKKSIIKRLLQPLSKKYKIRSLKNYSIDTLYPIYKKDPKNFYTILKQQGYPDNYINNIKKRFDSNLSASSIQKMYKNKIKKIKEKKLDMNTEIIPGKSEESKKLAEIWNKNNEEPQWIEIECDRCPNFQWFLSDDSSDYIILNSDNWHHITYNKNEYNMVLCNTCIQDSDVIISCEGCDEYYDPTTEQAKDNIIKDPYPPYDYYCKECFSQKVEEEHPNYQPSWQYRYKKDAYKATWYGYEFPYEYYDSENENSSESENSSADDY